jgi:hypothetical protein
MFIAHHCKLLMNSASCAHEQWLKPQDMQAFMIRHIKKPQQTSAMVKTRYNL